MDYEKKYKEALKRAKQLISKWTGKNKDFYVEDLRVTTKPLTSREWFNEGIKYAQSLQKEQKPNIELIQRSWYMEGYHDREFGNEPKWIIKTGEGGPRYEENSKYGQPLAEEQKQEWSEEDENRLNAVMELLENTSAIHPNYSHRKLIIWLKSLRPQYHGDVTMTESYKMGLEAGRESGLRDGQKYVLNNLDSYGLCKPAEWSEGRKKELGDYLLNMIKLVNTGAEKLRYTNDELEKYVEKCIQDVVDLCPISQQPKPEWSEEDENAFKYLHELISWGYAEKFMGAHTAHDIRAWVNERLRPDTFQNGNSRWKPSEEQMRILNWAANGMGAGIPEFRAVLRELYEQLEDYRKTKNKFREKIPRK